MTRTLHLFITASALALSATPALAQDPAGTAPSVPEATDAATDVDQPQAAPPEEIVVTARKRTETLLDVPIAVTAVSGDTIERRGLSSVRDIAALTPGLNVSGDGVGRAFVAIRGVGTTLVQTVQPGVGIFFDGVYQPNSSYLNNPLVDVERVEVLRGPQGTLYGKNTLGGAINVITKQPGNRFESTFIGSYARPDDSWFVSGSLSGPIIRDRLQARIAYGHREQDGFLYNPVLDIDANPLNTDSLNATIRAEPVDDVVLTVNGYADWVKGVNTPYAFVEGPTDYNREVQFNAANVQRYEYKGVNTRLAFPLASLATNVTVIGAYDQRKGRSSDADLDFSPLNLFRGSGRDELKTSTAELRFDSTLSPTLSSLIGLYYNRETTANEGLTSVIPLGLTLRDVSSTESDTYAAFGTLFWRPSEAWEVAAGLRVDRQTRRLEGASGIVGLGLTDVPDAKIKDSEISPRLTVTRHWSRDLMSYASVAKGFRGGGFNVNPRAPNRTYSGDRVWTYEVGSKYSSPDRRLSLSGALFYNDYKDFIGLNSIAPLDGGGFATIDLNTGDVESYGAELEGAFRPTRSWTISGGLTYVHARITDSSIYTDLTGRQLGSDRLPFQPDWSYSLNSDYVVPVGSGDLTLTAGLTGKGKRIAASLNETFAPELKGYTLVNAAVTYRIGAIEISAFANNLFDEDFFESYIEQTTLALAGLPMVSDLGITGDRRRYGVRTRIRF